MKKTLPFILLLISVNSAHGQITDALQRKEFKVEFVRSCMATADPEDKVLYAAMKGYCACSAESILDRFTKREMNEMNALSEEEQVATMTPVIKPCQDKLVKDVAAGRK